ncbi:MAG: IclR family transcriptional regulator [Rhodocyclales bacterium]|nr:IclR family transcriptional regulator [Rhodocyclales bacterium]
MPDNNDQQSSASLRAIAILEAIAGADGPLGLVEIMAATELPKPTVHRIVALLEGAALLVREAEGKRYAPGPRLASLGLATLTNTAWRAPRHAILRALVGEIGETCNLTLLDGPEVVYLDRVEAAWPLRLHFQTGSRVPVHCSASGKLLLALLPARERRRILDALPFSYHTANTLTRRRDLEEALKRIRRERLSTDNEEYLDGTVCVAVPVESDKRRVPAALAVHAPTTRMTLAQALQCVPALRRAAARLADAFPE